jgi:hypothetical protein
LVPGPGRRPCCTNATNSVVIPTSIKETLFVTISDNTASDMIWTDIRQN